MLVNLQSLYQHHRLIFQVQSACCKASRHLAVPNHSPTVSKGNVVNAWTASSYVLAAFDLCMARHFCFPAKGTQQSISLEIHRTPDDHLKCYCPGINHILGFAMNMLEVAVQLQLQSDSPHACALQHVKTT